MVCLADGSYGRLSLNAPKSAPGVTVQAADPGAATIAGATMAGSYITLAQFRVQGGSVDVQPASTGMTIDHNLMVGNRTDYAVYVCPGTTTVRCNDVSITNNKIQGSFDEDQIQANLYHDGPDADPYGLLVEGTSSSGTSSGATTTTSFSPCGAATTCTSARTTCTTSAARASS